MSALEQTPPESERDKLHRLGIYEPLDWQASVGHRVGKTVSNGRPQCRARVHARDGWGFHQCSKPGAVEVEGFWFCKVHDPEAAAKRAAEVAERDRVRWRKSRIEWAGARFRKALKEIADGHNDPRSLAREVLGDLYED